MVNFTRLILIMYIMDSNFDRSENLVKMKRDNIWGKRTFHCVVINSCNRRVQFSSI